MFKRLFYFSLAATCACIAYLYAGTSPQGEENHVAKKIGEWRGKNNTVLFVTNSEHGFANVFLATSHALLTEYNDLDIHFATFEKLEDDITMISNFALNTGSKRTITFHELKGPSYKKSLNGGGFKVDSAINSPSLADFNRFCSNLEKMVMPWTAPDYLDIYKEISGILETVDPSIVAVDPVFGPGVDAVRAQGRNHVIISPNTLKDSFAKYQPWGAVLWKYPVLSSAFPYPVPWHLIPSNIYRNLRLAYSVLFAPTTSSKRAYLKENGIAKPMDFFTVYHKDYPWISQSSQELEYPLDIIPENVVQCGPIFLSTATAAEQDPELSEWLNNSPTVLINLGSVVDYDHNAATEMAKAIRILLDNATVQVLWKFNKRHPFTDEFLDIISPDLESGRIRMSKWIKVDPAVLLETGNIIASVHHGGANCFYEAIGTGIPQVVLPLWVDLYDYAVKAEYLGVGVWGSRKAAPYWKADELSTAFLQVVGDSAEAISMRKKARELSLPYKAKPGRITAAHELAKLARSPGSSL
ncbi:hypothetical protein EAE99_002494 [Botrytis elliptica]|nr:hypothetical protein EAE99_002494 [Botrytis elliptica]